MRTMIAGATFLLVSAGAASVGALSGIAVNGSDTLFDITQDVIAACPLAATPAPGLTYQGGGSTGGENNMRTGVQTVSPMSRFLNPKQSSGADQTCAVNGGRDAEGLVVGLDGLAIAGAKSTVEGCELARDGRSVPVTDQNGAAGVQCPGCDAANNYVLGDIPGSAGGAGSAWKDILRVIYFGRHHDAAQTTDCASDVRFSIANSWGSLFQASCGAGGCTQLKHAFRRNDLSGTTDTFIGVLGGPNVTSGGKGAFCNTTGVTLSASGQNQQGDYFDADPIRRTCDGDGSNAGEQVCGKDGKLGLVTVVYVPDKDPATIAAAYPDQLCTTGVFRVIGGFPFGFICPNGVDSKLTFSACLTPVRSSGGTINPACINRKTNCPFGTPAGTDCRAFNNVPRLATGGLLKDAQNKLVLGAGYRLHTTQKQAAGTGLCKQNDSTSQIGCLTAASPCSIGFAGREAVGTTNPDTVAVAIKGKLPTVENVQNLVNDPANSYQFSRKLYLATLTGFGSAAPVGGQELELAKCFADASITQGPGKVIENRGFVSVPGGVKCQDFDETLCGAATNTNACANNPAGIPQ